MKDRQVPITRMDVPVLECWKGAILHGVEYYYLPPLDSTGYAGEGELIDVDLAAVVVDFGEGGKWTISWAMDGEFEGLAVDKSGSYAGVESKALDMTKSDHFRSLNGTTVNGVAVSWHSSGDQLPDSVWAIRLCFAHGDIVLALGGVDASGLVPEYSPNEMVVLFDEALAKSYRPSGVPRSAWGVLAY